MFADDIVEVEQITTDLQTHVNISIVPQVVCTKSFAEQLVRRIASFLLFPLSTKFSDKLLKIAATITMYYIILLPKLKDNCISKRKR